MGKTSFKDLLAKGGSNPLVNLQSLKDQRRKRRAIASAAPPGARAVAAPADAPAGFLACASFAGARPGYTFKAGPAGEDPSNRGREVAATNKEQQLREEMDEFNKLVRADIETAKANDAEEIEEEADLSQLQALQEQVQLSKRVDGLHDMRQKALVVAARVAQEVAATKAERAAAAADDGDPGFA
ncbi:hypothetical protein EMIHUDRAFT_234945 [Emiliania huxleyi CCMP1516]|uniref:Nascent polypeptide-associated complex subunit alpha-like UBA domain-containing protein n=2 Tax=Emiliania huxleyi TaxID=2903 RepID=A0A0D3JXG0_EMIH1|nr:hypothetical protein EMIHUDRAFT_234945 [Emiliania huxleyi CCMP1516]EOD28195.1 hypothetical protein EMIHUDRAFT_234945 [Emiliania huxleyi CCMP1516]|eukprot:XP_005780624.1 hypothetical protein EMIHUDRAFT_234945 [Emiliania huxleyi CCMP1516]